MSEIEARMMWAPGKYIQGQNVLPNLGVYVRLLGESACRTEESIHNEPFDVTPKMVSDALLAADVYFREFRAQQQNTSFSPKPI